MAAEAESVPETIPEETGTEDQEEEAAEPEPVDEMEEKVAEWEGRTCMMYLRATSV